MSQISEQRRGQIVSTARRIVDEKGPAHLTAEAITHEVGVSRPLLYHYFANMGDLLGAVIDIYVAEFAERLAAWEDSAPKDLAQDAGAWSLALAELLRPNLVDKCPLLIGSEQGGCSSAYPQFVAGCANVLATHAVDDASPALAPVARAKNPRETLHFALLGLWGMLKACPQTSDDVVASAFSALWFDAPAPAAHEPAPAPVPAAKPEPEKPGRKGLFGRIFN